MKKKLSLLFVISAILSFSVFAEIKVLNPWVRPSSAGKNAVLFMKVVNTSNQPDELLKAHTKSASSAELYSDINEEGKKVEQRVGFIKIPPQGNADLKTDGRHIILENINHSLKEGDRVDVTLGFKNGENVNISVPVKSQQ